MQRQIGVVLCTLLLLCACSGKKKPDEKAGKVARADTTALWQLAPADTAIGVVVADGVGKRFQAAASEVFKILASRPVIQDKLLAPVQEEMRAALEIDPFDPNAVAASGLDLGKGAAIFLNGEGEPLLMVLPVSDRARFSSIAKMRAEKIEDLAVDRDDEMICAEIGGRYLCAETVDRLRRKDDKATVRPLAARVAALPERARGGVELVIDIPGVAGSEVQDEVVKQLLGELGLGVVSTRLRPGKISMHLHLVAKPTSSIQVRAPVPASFRSLDRGAGSLIRTRLVLPALLANLSVPANLPMGSGIDLRTGLLDHLTGDIALITHGRDLYGWSVLVGVSDEAPVRVTLKAMCKMIGAAGPLSGLEITDNGCKGSVDMGNSLPPEMPLGDTVRKAAEVKLSLEVRDGAIRARGGDPASNGDGPGVSASKHTAHLFGADALLVVWGRSFDPLATLRPEIRAEIDRVIPTLGEDVRPITAAVRWVLAQLAEAGISVTAHENGLDAEVVLATFRADPAGVYGSYIDAVNKDLDGDVVGYRAALAALGKAHPDTLAGRQAELVAADAPAIGMVSGVIAALAIPALMKYIERLRALEQADRAAEIAP